MINKINSFNDIIAWQKAHRLVLNVYRVTKLFPSCEKFGLMSQMRRSAVSVASNIVEGFARKRIKDCLNFYIIANASLEELKYQLLISLDVDYISENLYDKLMEGCNEVGKVLHGWVKSQKMNVRLSSAPVINDIKK